MRTASLKTQNLWWLLRGFFGPDECGGIFFKDGDAIHIQAPGFADLGSLPMAVKTAVKYLPLKPGDVVLLSDPYSGGTLLSSFTLIRSVAGTGRAPDLLIATRHTLRPRYRLAKNIDEEGVRIPPTPIRSEGLLNQAILEAIGTHPLATEGLIGAIVSAIGRIDDMARLLEPAAEIYDITLSKVALTQYLQESQKIIQDALGELPHGGTKLTVVLDGDVRLKLHLENLGDRIRLDFNGTTPSPFLALTDATTFGACMGALALVLPIPVPMNEASFRALEVITPSGTFLNARYPAPVFLGMLDGTSLVANTVLRAFGQMIPTMESASTDPGHCLLDIRFSDGRHFYDTLAGGTGANKTTNGEDGVDPWQRTKLQASIEEIEKRFPLQIQTVSVRPLSGGKGKHPGGNGLTKTYRLLLDAELNWSLGPDFRIEGLKGGTSGAGPELTLHTPAGDKIDLEHHGTRNLAAGTLITLLSSGGGGYGS